MPKLTETRPGERLQRVLDAIPDLKQLRRESIPSLLIPSPLDPNKTPPPYQGRDTTRGTTLIARLRWTFSSGHGPEIQGRCPLPL